ncbi:hypothetical protein Dda_4319 [Drechslerella dactyloides]|uniref:Bromo domain-containing protein n=1 Tax=Drechslerella dactyloides TaxID=74499 RepID=A0AAD6IWT2_DREDA|nr:hypothetical protein Dda_4319 [Drechslerella dactyloides]
MPSTTLTSPQNTTSYDTLEKLLLCVEVVQHGETGQSFIQISSALKENSLLTSSPNYDPGRLSGDTLRERWRDLVREEGLVGSGGSEDGGSSTASTVSRRGRVSMRNGMITNTSSTPTPSATVPIGEKAVRDLARKMWDVYQKAMREQIQSDERDIAQLLDEIGNLENERAKEIEDMEAEETRKREAAAKAAAEQAKAEAMAAAAAAPSKSVSPVLKKLPLPEPKKLDEPFVEQSSSQQQASQLTTLRTTPPSPSKASLKNILTDESSQHERSSVPSDSQSSPDSASRIGYDPIRDGSRAREAPSAVPETPHHPHRLPSIPATEPIPGPFQIYEKPPASLRRLSGSGNRPQLPEFNHHLPGSSPRQPPLTPPIPRIGTFTQPGQRGPELATSPTYSRHEHEQGYPSGHQSPLSALNLSHGGASRPPEEVRTPRQSHLPPPAFSPTTPSYPPTHSSPSRNHFPQSLPSIHQLSPQRTPVQPPGYPSPNMQRLPSQEYHPHHSPISEHPPLHSPPLGFSHSGNVPQSPYAHQATLPHPSQSPRTPGFPQPTMPPPQYSPTHAPPGFYQGQYPHSQQPSPHLQPAFSPSHQNFPPPMASPENKLPPINTPTQLAPLQFATPKAAEPGRPASPLRPRPDEISPVLAPDGEAFGIPDMTLDERLIGRRRLAKEKAATAKTEPKDEMEEHAPTTARQESVDPSDDKATAKATGSIRGRSTRGSSKSRGTAASTRSRRGQSVSSVGTAEPEEMDIDVAEPTAKEESVAPEPVREEEEPAKSAKKRPLKKKFERDETSGAEEATAPKAKRGVTRRHHLEPSASTEPETMNDAIETPRDAATPVEPATPRPSFNLDNLSATPTPTSATQVKKFAQRANPLLNNVSAHRFANLFMKPVDERSAPGYSRIVYKPQDIKSIRACIKAGAAQNAAGTPALTPTPTADGSFGTTPSTPTASSAPLLTSKSAITNSAQLEKEIWRMFANAVMYNKSNSMVALEAREMARDVGTAIDNFRNAERIGERRAAEVAKERGIPAVAAVSLASVSGAVAGRRRGSLIKSEMMGDDDSRKGDDDDEQPQDEEEAEEESVKNANTEKKKKGATKAKATGSIGRATRRGKKDKDGDVDMEDKPDEEEAEEGSESEKSEDDDADEEEGDGDASGGEADAEVAAEEETKTTKGAKGRAAAAAKAKNTKTTRAAAAAAASAATTTAATTAAKGRGTRKGSAQPAAEADDEEAEKTKGRGRGSGRTRGAKGRG